MFTASRSLPVTAINFRYLSLEGILETIAWRFQDFLSGLRRRSIV